MSQFLLQNTEYIIMKFSLICVHTANLCNLPSPNCQNLCPYKNAYFIQRQCFETAHQVHSLFKINLPIYHQVIFSKDQEKASDVCNLCFHPAGGIKAMSSFL